MGNVGNNCVLELLFPFTNQGSTPLVINRADVSCGCVKVIYPQEPVMGGKKGTIQVNVDVRLLNGFFAKKILIFSNPGNDCEELIVKGNVRD